MAAKEKEISALREESRKNGFWEDKDRAVEVGQSLSALEEEVDRISALKKEVFELEEFKALAEEDQSFEAQLSEKMADLETRITKEEFKTFLSGKYDKGSAILGIYSGAGGQDAQDWATMLLRMYQRYSERKGFQVKVISQSFGDSGTEGRIGTKQAFLEIKGRYAYGFLKKETGVHRLVRISPFSAQSLRHTSFTLVEVLPDLGKSEKREIEIKSEDLKVDTYRASGPGGQYVNKRESAVRITHVPTKIVVSCQSERLQGQNREKAMDLLYAKLFQLRDKEEKKEIEKFKGGAVQIEWGSQIRSYVLHPYKMVKDLRTNVETSNAESVLDGDLDRFIEAEIKEIS